MKKKLLLILGVVIIAFAIVFFIIKGRNNSEDNTTKEENYANNLSNNFNPNIMVVGEDIGIQKYMECRYLDKVTEETLLDGRDFGYNCIILADLNSTLKITDEELLLIKSYCEEKGYDMIYVGTSYFDTFIRLGFTYSFNAGEKSLCYEGSIAYAEYANVENKPEKIGYAAHGVWTTETEKYDTTALAEILCMMSYYAEKSNSLKANKMQ